MKMSYHLEMEQKKSSSITTVLIIHEVSVHTSLSHEKVIHVKGKENSGRMLAIHTWKGISGAVNETLYLVNGECKYEVTNITHEEDNITIHYNNGGEDCTISKKEITFNPSTHTTHEFASYQESKSFGGWCALL